MTTFSITEPTVSDNLARTIAAKVRRSGATILELAELSDSMRAWEEPEYLETLEVGSVTLEGYSDVIADGIVMALEVLVSEVDVVELLRERKAMMRGIKETTRIVRSMMAGLEVGLEILAEEAGTATESLVDPRSVSVTV